MYHAAHFDEITAIQNYLDGLKVAVYLKNIDAQMAVYNNIGTLFVEKDDFTTGLNYIGKAYTLFLTNKKEIKGHIDIIVLFNMMDLYMKIGRIEDAVSLYQQYKDDLNTYTEQQDQPILSLLKLYLSFATKDKERTLELVDYFIQSGLHHDINRNLYFSFYKETFYLILKLEDKQRADQLLRCMGAICLADDIEQQLQLHLCWINFAETFHMEDALLASYKQYYQLQKQINDATNKFKADSMKEKILVNDMQTEKESIIKEKQILESRVKIDGLTKLFNRAHFTKLVEHLQHNKSVSTIGIIIMDIDYFKQYNDFYGHYQGDRVLRIVAQCLDINCDSQIFSARYGGDEFICACVNMSNQEIEDYLNKVIQDLDSRHIEHKKSKVLDAVSVSAGYANLKNDEFFQLDVAINIADSALYQVKSSGRNNFAYME